VSDAYRVSMVTVDGGPTSDDAVDELITEVDGVAEIPNSLRGTTPVETRRTGA
jgi:hypothetical protein